MHVIVRYISKILFYCIIYTHIIRFSGECDAVDEETRSVRDWQNKLI